MRVLNEKEKEKYEVEEPRIGKRPVFKNDFWLEWKEGRQNVKVMLDTGCDLPVLSTSYCLTHNVPVVQRKQPWTIKGFSGDAVESWYHTPLITLGFENYRERMAFEVKEVAEVDILLPNEKTLRSTSLRVRTEMRGDSFSIFYTMYICQIYTCKPIPLRVIFYKSNSVCLTIVSNRLRITVKHPRQDYLFLTHPPNLPTIFLLSSLLTILTLQA